MPRPTRKLSALEVSRKLGFRSGLEGAVANQLAEAGVRFKYEQTKLPFTQPAQERKYTPDFFLKTRGSGKKIIIETKGRFLAADRKKMLWVREAHPHLDIRFVFSRSKTTISKKSKTTYADWCNKHGFLYADKEVPEAWLDE